MAELVFDFWYIVDVLKNVFWKAAAERVAAAEKYEIAAEKYEIAPNSLQERIFFPGEWSWEKPMSPPSDLTWVLAENWVFFFGKFCFDRYTEIPTVGRF